MDNDDSNHENETEDAGSTVTQLVAIARIKSSTDVRNVATCRIWVYLKLFKRKIVLGKYKFLDRLLLIHPSIRVVKLSTLENVYNTVICSVKHFCVWILQVKPPYKWNKEEIAEMLYLQRLHCI